MSDRFLMGARKALFENICGREVDLLVVGGGIMGAAVFRDAVLRGLRAALVESRDFASGASGRGTGIVQSGQRQLAGGRFDLIMETLRERELQLRLNSRIVKSLPVVVPLYEHGRSRTAMNIRLSLHELLAGLRDCRRHRFLTPRESLTYAPQLKWAGLRGGCLYYDAVVTDYRLTLETIKDAVRRGGIALNYAPAVKIVRRGGRVGGADVLDTLTGHNHAVRARCVVAAAGAFTEEVRRLDGTSDSGRVCWERGTHLLLAEKDLPLEASLVFPSALDGRMLSLVKRDGYILYGTTGERDDAGPACPRPGGREVSYLLESLNALMPTIGLTRDRVLHAFAGLSPTGSPESARSASRHGGDAQIHTAESGLITVTGADLAGSRMCAERVVDKVVAVLGLSSVHFRCKTAKVSLGGRAEEIHAGAQYWKKRLAARGARVDEWFERYGIDGHLLCREMERFDTPTTRMPDIEVETRYLCRCEMVCSIEDLMLRRFERTGATAEEILARAQYLLPVLKSEVGISEQEARTQLRSLSRTLRLEYAVPPEPCVPGVPVRSAGMLVSATVICSRRMHGEPQPANP